jgi:hypothetical protein
MVSAAQFWCVVSEEREEIISSIVEWLKQRSMDSRREPESLKGSREGRPVENSSRVSLMMLQRSCSERVSGKTSSARRASTSGSDEEWR